MAVSSKHLKESAMSLQRRFALLPLCLSLLGGSTALYAAGAKDAPSAPVGPTATLTATSDAGSASITVDGGGSFMDAFVSSAADGLSVDVSFRSNLFFDGATYSPENVTQKGSAKATSSYTIGSLEVALLQKLSAGPIPGSYLLEQIYRLSNPGTEPVTTNVVRYNDSDMYDPVTNQFIGDSGYQPAAGKYSYIVSNTAPAPAMMTHYIGVQMAGGDTATRRAVRFCCSNIDDILPAENNTVPNDDNGDGISDFVADMAIANQAPVTVPAGGTTKLKVTTLFGRSALTGLTALPAR
jgi:hypothetical protein